MPAKKRRKAETRRYNVDFMCEMAVLSQLTTNDVKKACCIQTIMHRGCIDQHDMVYAS